MEVDTPPSRSLVAAGKADTDIRVILHPLPLMSISDYIVRHTLREQPGPVVGALFGQQNGHETTIELAFECKTNVQDGQAVSLDQEWFDTRLDQMREVHKAHALNLVGWFTLTPPAGPSSAQLPINHTISQALDSNNGLLLAVHPSALSPDTASSNHKHNSNKGALPLSIYQWEYRKGASGELDPQKVSFHEVEYTVETGEAEMIGLSYVASGAANASMSEQEPAAPASTSTIAASLSSPASSQQANTGKRRTNHQEDEGIVTSTAPNGTAKSSPTTNREDDELIASLTAKSNAIKMLRSRIDLLTNFLSSSAPTSPKNASILRQIQATTHQLRLVVPSNTEEFSNEMTSEKNDVRTVELLNEIMQSLGDSREVGRMASVVEGAKARKEKKDDRMGMDALLGEAL